uniref:Uncharacterized protein n=1 Tax=Cacopsylla melanoneura TaxID=428564 RepID=A0A8D9FIY0_9HEMI
MTTLTPLWPIFLQWWTQVNFSFEILWYLILVFNIFCSIIRSASYLRSYSFREPIFNRLVNGELVERILEVNGSWISTTLPLKIKLLYQTSPIHFPVKNYKL